MLRTPNKLNPSQNRARKQEKEAAKLLSGKVTPASGAKDEKGDVRCKGILRLECKTTKHRSFSVTLEMLEKIEAAALSSGEIPAMEIEFNDGQGNKIKSICLIPMYALEELIKG